MNQKVNNMKKKNNYKNSSNFSDFGLWPQKKITTSQLLRLTGVRRILWMTTTAISLSLYDVVIPCCIFYNTGVYMFVPEEEKSSILFCQRTQDKDICLNVSPSINFPHNTHQLQSHKVSFSLSSPPPSSHYLSLYPRVKLFMQILFISVMFCHIETSKTLFIQQNKHQD